NATGNIVIITDAEETDTGFNLKVPDNISIALIGIGTARGSNIPLRDSRGVSQGVKKFQGKEVITKLDESFIKKLGSEIKYYNYWIASSYSLPTEEVL